MKLSILILTAGLAAGAVAASAATRDGQRVAVEGTRFVRPDGTAFEWRGITAFMLVELVASGNEAEAAAYLDWAAANGVTVVRVLTMAHHLFRLTPADGLRALPRLLELAAERGVHVEVVALADTEEHVVDLDAHVAAIGNIAAAHPNAFVEIANEPFHETQVPALHDRDTLARLATAVPNEVVVALGAGALDNSGGGDYVTVHTPRGTPWEHVTALAEGRALVTKYGRPVVSDEPVGAAAELRPGARDNSPERFRAAALLTRMTGMYATFHYEGGLQARIPEGIEAECFKAWSEAWTLLPAGIEAGTFSVREATKGGLYETRLGEVTWVLAVAGAPLPAELTTVFMGPASALGRSAPSASGQ
ncbi:MAG TPA: hypothetical protein VMN81_12390 [Vicinamibacterales bacterium]|nr:hypothetical protein [Vicinamibacterales bacterium]